MSNCDSNRKAPATRRDCKDAITDPELVSAWFKNLKDANIGVATGSPSGFFVVDIDSKNCKAAFQHASEICGED